MGRTVRGAMDGLWKPVFTALMCVLLSLQATYGQNKDESTQQTNARIQELAGLGKSPSADIPLGAGDLIRIEVFDVPELSRDIRVSTTGLIGFPLVHERIEAAGLTPFELEQKIQDLLIQNGLVSRPLVSVIVKEQISQPVTIIGAVEHPMTYQVVNHFIVLRMSHCYDNRHWL